MLCIKRLKVEFTRLQKDPVPLAIAFPLESNILEWRFVIKGVDQYEGGYYHGKLIFPKEYPLKPPSILFCTPSGRFETGRRICLSISDFHPETWSPSWTIGTILTGIVSFMNSEEMTTGGISATREARRVFASQSIAFNNHDKVYVELFGTDPEALFSVNDETIAKNQESAKAVSTSSTSPSKVPEPVMKSPPQSLESSSLDDTNVVSQEASCGGLTKSAKRRLKEKLKKAPAGAGEVEINKRDGDGKDADEN